jgi:hypothetical protein
MTLKETRRSRCPRGTHALGSFSSYFSLLFSPTFLAFLLGGQHTYHRRIAAIGMLSLLSCFVSPLTEWTP